MTRLYRAGGDRFTKDLLIYLLLLHTPRISETKIGDERGRKIDLRFNARAYE
jgi:hypothetical protein